VKRSISEQNSHAQGINDAENFSKLEDRHPRPPPPPNPPPRGQRRPPPPLPPTSPTSSIRPAQPNPPGSAKPNLPVQSKGTGTLQHLLILLLSSRSNKENFKWVYFSTSCISCSLPLDS